LKPAENGENRKDPKEIPTEEKTEKNDGYFGNGGKR
jgi:hypothetical protein